MTTESAEARCSVEAPAKLLFVMEKRYRQRSLQGARHHASGDTVLGDDIPDIGTLRMCGFGVAVSNVCEKRKAAADGVIGGNDSEAIAEYLENTVLWHQNQEV